LQHLILLLLYLYLIVVFYLNRFVMSNEAPPPFGQRMLALTEPGQIMVWAMKRKYSEQMPNDSTAPFNDIYLIWRIIALHLHYTHM
jgi:hypothetical protein